MASKADRCEGCEKVVPIGLINYVYTEVDGGFASFCYSCFTKVYNQMVQDGVESKITRQGV